MHETQPFKGSGPDAYASSPLIGANDDKPDEGTPFVAPPADAPPPPVSDAEALMIGKMVRGYWTIGSTLLAVKRPQEAAALAAIVSSIAPGADFETAQRACGDMIQESASRLAIQMNIRFKYADHAVVIGALGVATAGFVVKPAANSNGVVNGPPAGAKNANTPSSSSSSTSEDAPPATAAPDDDEEIVL